MAKVKIITDACSDITKEWRDKYDIECAPLSLLWGEQEKIANCDWDVYTAKELYDAMRSGIKIKSNQVSITTFEELFNKYLDEGCDIVYVGCSSALSGSVTTGAAVAKKIIEEKPEAKIFCIDPKVSCGGEALVAVEAAKLAAQGLTVEEVYEKTVAIAKTIRQVFTVDNLNYLKNAGRIKASKAFFGNLFGVKPMIVNDVRGANVAVGKAKGKKNALDMCVDMLKDAICYDGNEYPVSEQTIYIGHADTKEDADYLVEKIKAEINPKDVYVNYIGPVIGASVGPGAVVLYGFGKQVTLGA